MSTPSFEGRVTRSCCGRAYGTRNTVTAILQNRAVTEHRESELLPREAVHSKGLEHEILEFTPVCNVILPAVSLLFLEYYVASMKIRTPNGHNPKKGLNLELFGVRNLQFKLHIHCECALCP